MYETAVTVRLWGTRCVVDLVFINETVISELLNVRQNTAEYGQFCRILSKFLYLPAF